ncbi:ATP-binding protein [Natranaerobius trueperi]|uniref:Histidine kinase/HSP90-like ATPase domain-containing protein n=1 Tax=Natranaerobius trueperi TaxID=759412 RepID=A0A226BWJ7_9FIRM|nr:ATP-binding protein [Natranaerobius trueperi]OWZ82674.1 hypothetical protein CDO51_12805 [Natranaerobius trueperi]
MKKTNQKIKGILDELLSNSFKAGATNIESKITSKDNKHVVYVKDNGKGMESDILEKAKEKLGQPRRDELEDYYGDLAGIAARNSGLTIVGMMIDDYVLISEPGKGTEITVIIDK